MANLNVAILIIGSLIWNKCEHRESWRRDRLQVRSAIPVSVPIRYGRLSVSGTYTMVFSNELVPSRLGRAFVVPCRSTVSTPDQLVNEAEALWAAEAKSSETPAISTKWGAVGLLVNPQQTIDDDIQAGWLRRVASERQHYEEFRHAVNEHPAVNRDGMLSFPWPKAESGDPLPVAMLLATANQPCLISGSYATPRVIADAWAKKRKSQVYFEENRRAGIITADDDLIMQYLNQ